MKKQIAFSIIASMLAFSLLTGCGEKTDTSVGTDTPGEQPTANFEGVIAAVEEGVITLENGQKIIITEDTDLGDGAALQPGDYIQGYTQNAPDAEQITADIILKDAARQETDAKDETGSEEQKNVVNFEGIVSSVKDGTVVLEDGKVIRITANTVFGDTADTAKTVSEDIRPGNFIQGYSKDALDAEQRTADYIWVNTERSEQSETGD